MKTLAASTALSCLFFFFLSGLLFSDAFSEEGRWKLIGKSRTDSCWYVDAETLCRLSGDIVSLWVKTIPAKTDMDYSEEDEPDVILKKIQARNFGDYEYTEGLWEVDCSKGMFRILYFCAYGKDGGVVTSLLTPDADWSFILPGSVGVTVRDAVCKP